MEIPGVDELMAYAREYLQYIREKKTNGATVVGLYGDLGAGKTTFVQCVARELGVTEAVTSPTFVIQKSHSLEGDTRFTKLVHVDAYRIGDAKELEVLGWKDTIADPAHLVLIEWAGNVEAALPEDAEKITFTVVDEDTRDIQDGR